MGKKTSLRLVTSRYILATCVHPGEEHEKRKSRVRGMLSDTFYIHIVCRCKTGLCVFFMFENANQTERDRNADYWIESCITCVFCFSFVL